MYGESGPKEPPDEVDEFCIHPECSPPLVNASHFYAAPKRSNGMSQRQIPLTCGIKRDAE
jgi:hypothetical protein